MLELSAAGTVLHRQLHAVARADGRDIPVDAVPENKPEGQTPPGSPLREARTHEDHPTQVSVGEEVQRDERPSRGECGQRWK